MGVATQVLRLYLSWALALLLASWLKLSFNSPWVNVLLWSTLATIVTRSLLKAKSIAREGFQGIQLNWPTALLLLVGGPAVSIAIIYYFKSLGLTSFPTPLTYKNILNHHWPLWSAFALIAIAPAILEEFTFRLLIYGHLKSRFSNATALILQAVLFSLLHMRLAMFPSHLLLGLYLGMLRQSSKSIYLCLLIHISWNVWALLKMGSPLSLAFF